MSYWVWQESVLRPDAMLQTGFHGHRDLISRETAISVRVVHQYYKDSTEKVK